MFRIFLYWTQRYGSISWNDALNVTSWNAATLVLLPISIDASKQTCVRVIDRIENLNEVIEECKVWEETGRWKFGKPKHVKQEVMLSLGRSVSTLLDSWGTLRTSFPMPQSNWRCDHDVNRMLCASAESGTTGNVKSSSHFGLTAILWSLSHNWKCKHRERQRWQKHAHIERKIEGWKAFHEKIQPIL